MNEWAGKIIPRKENKLLNSKKEIKCCFLKLTFKFDWRSDKSILRHLADSDFRSVEGVEAWSYIDVLVENNLSGKLNKNFDGYTVIFISISEI